MVNICGVCGRLVPEEDIFCPGCGTSIPQAERKRTPREAEVLQSVQKTCAHCGRDLRPGQLFCLYCAHPTPEKLRQRAAEHRK